MPPSIDFRSGIVRILHADGSTAGTGFVASVDGLIITCSHVIQHAKAQKAGKLQPETITLVFHATGEKAEAKVVAQWWRGCNAEDLAFLRLLDGLPNNIKPLRLGTYLPTNGEQLFRTFGFANPNPEGGLPGGGEIVGDTELRCTPVLMLRSQEVTPGFSGAPVWDDTHCCVLGIVSQIAVQDDYGRLGASAFALRSEAMAAVCPELILEPSEGQELSAQANSEIENILSAAYPIFTDARIIQVAILQVFRLADILTSPQSVRAKRFYEIITDRNKYRRALTNKWGFNIPPYGTLKPIIVLPERFNLFWKTALPDLRIDIDPLNFIPFELDLSAHLQRLKPQPGSVLEHAMRGTSRIIQNMQINGHLRIYPPGTGIIKLGMTLEFKKGIQTEAVAELTRNVENLLFIDPEGQRIPCETLFLDIINQVANEIFKKEMYANTERRWQPPETTFSFRDYKGNNIQNLLDELARLLSYAPANRENISDLRKRVERSINSNSWKKDHMLSVVGQGVALVLVPTTIAGGKKEKQKQYLDWFMDIRELIAAAIYTQKTFADRIEEIYQLQLLDDDWMSEKDG